jgi:prepilin-type N-terminal cleavage/methylation domain-containing protein
MGKKFPNSKFQIPILKRKETSKVFEYGKLSRGFSLVEVLLSMAIMAIVGLTAVPFYSRFFSQNAVANTYDQLTGELRKAQLYAMTGKQAGSWGVHNGGTQLMLFQGSTYAARNTSFDETFTVNGNVTISGFTDIIFAQVTGLPNTTATITVKAINIQKTITVNAQGAIN